MINQKIAHLDQILKDNDLNIMKFNSVINDLYKYKGNDLFEKAMIKLRNDNEVIKTSCTMQGRAYEKKYRYAGDFEIIDKIYTEYVSENKSHAKWDEYFHQQPAPIAVRNRKKYFISKIAQLYNNESMSILNLASGPCRDILELLELYDAPKIHFDCVELDKNAIAYGRELLKNYSSKVVFINKNIFRFVPKKRYDVIWSAGLFDYFDDKTFVAILKRLIASNNKGKIIIGNFSDENPTMPYMEIIGEWFLHYRGADKLVELAIKAGADEKSISIEKEPENVNLFLNIN